MRSANVHDVDGSDTVVLVDSHCHLPQVEDAGGGAIAEILQRASQAGVTRLLSVGIDLVTFPRLLAIADAFHQVSISVGVHPNHVAPGPNSLGEILLRLGSLPRVVAIGETGLDYFRGEVSRQQQQQRLREHIRAARELCKPLILHMRDAGDDIFRILDEEQAECVSGVMHCFTGGAREASQALERGFCLSFAGIVSFKSAADLRNVVRTVPLSRLLLETDSPWLAPVPHRGRRNEPAFVRLVADAVADIRGESVELIATETTANFYRLFGLAGDKPGR